MYVPSAVPTDAGRHWESREESRRPDGGVALAVYASPAESRRAEHACAVVPPPSPPRNASSIYRSRPYVLWPGQEPCVVGSMDAVHSTQGYLRNSRG